MNVNISIIIPVYNGEKTIRRCLESITNQTYTNLEIIVVNDGSKDNTETIISDIAKKDSRIRLITLKNGGVSNARNQGINAAMGDYITFIDADDWIEKDAYEKVVFVIDKYNPDVIKFGYSICDDNHIIDTKLPLSKIEKYDEKYINEKLLPDYLQTLPIFSATEIGSACVHVFRKKIITDNSVFFRNVVNEDPMFSFEALSFAKSYYPLQISLYNYYTRTDSASHVYIKDYYNRKCAQYDLYKRICNERNLVAKDRLPYYYINSVYSCINNEFRKISGRKLKDALVESKRIYHLSNVKEYIKNTTFDDLTLKGKILLFLMKHECRIMLYILLRIKDR